MIITDEEVRSSYLSLKEKLQQIDIEEQNDINDKVNHEDNNNISNNVNASFLNSDRGSFWP